MDLEAIIRNLDELGAQMNAIDVGSPGGTLSTRGYLPLHHHHHHLDHLPYHQLQHQHQQLQRLRQQQQQQQQQQEQQQKKKKTRHNVSFSDKPPVFIYEPESAAADHPSDHIYEGIDQYCSLAEDDTDCKGDSSGNGGGGDSTLTLASLLESRRSQLSVEQARQRKLVAMDTELESVLRDLHVLSEGCETENPMAEEEEEEEDDDDDDEGFPPPPPIPPPPETTSAHYDDDDNNDEDTLRLRTSPGGEFQPAVYDPQGHHESRPLSHDSHFSSDSMTNSSTNDSVSNRSTDSHGDRPAIRHPHLAAAAGSSSRNLQNHSLSFSGSLPQVSIHAKNPTQMCVKVHAEDGSTKTIAVAKETTVHQLCCVLIKKYRHLPSNGWSVVEQWNDICSERLLEGHMRVLEEIKKWSLNSDNKLWFANIPKKYDLFKDAQITEALVTDSYVPNCEGQLYLKSVGKKSWKKFPFVLRSSGLYYSTKGKANKSADLTCLSSLEDVDIFTSLQGWAKELKAPTRFGLILKPSCSSKLNVQNPLKCLCAEDARALQKWVDALRLAKYGRMIYADFLTPIVLPGAAPSSVAPLQHHVNASWSNLIEDELDRVANNHTLHKNSLSLRDCSRLNASLDSPFHQDEVPSPRSAGCVRGGFVTPNLSLNSSSFSPDIPVSPNVANLLNLNLNSNSRVACHVPTGASRSSSSTFDGVSCYMTADTGNAVYGQIDDPVYDFISESITTNGRCHFPGQPRTPFGHPGPPLCQAESMYVVSNSKSYESLNARRIHQAMDIGTPYQHQTHYHPVPAAHTNGDQRTAATAAASTAPRALSVEEAMRERFEFPAPPTPEIFQFLRMNKSDFVPKKQVAQGQTNGFYRQGSLNRSFIRNPSGLDHVYRAIDNRYTVEPGQSGLRSSLHRSFHSGEEQSSISPAKGSAVPPPPPKRVETLVTGGCTKMPDIPPPGYSRGALHERQLQHGNALHAIELLERTILKKHQLGASGPSDVRGSVLSADYEDLPPPPKELLENLKLQRLQDKYRFVLCNS